MENRTLDTLHVKRQLWRKASLQKFHVFPVLLLQKESLVLLRHRQTQLTLPSPGEEWQTDPQSLCPKRISDLLKCTELDS